MRQHPILSLSAPNLRGFFAQCLQWKQDNALRDDRVTHYVWQCQRAPQWAAVQQDLAAVLAAASDGADKTQSAQWLNQLAATLHTQWWGLLPGWHRMALEDERLILHIAVGAPLDILQSTTGRFGHILLHASAIQSAMPAANTPDTNAPHKSHNWHDWANALKHLCLHGTCLHSESPLPPDLQQALAQTGWVPPDTDKAPPVSQSTPAPHWERLVYAPHWLPRQAPQPFLSAENRQAVVIGAGLAGAATAYSLARRGWQVTVLDAHPQPAGGASGLPVGLLVPHSSADDTRISQISRAGIRCTLQRMAALLQQGQDWFPSGVLEHCVQGRSKLPRHWPHAETVGAEEDPCVAAGDWSRPADATQVQQAHLPPDAISLWHAHAAWIKPPQLIAALLRHPRIRWQGGNAVAELVRQKADENTHQPPLWTVLDSHKQPLAQAPLVVIAASFDSRALLQSALRAAEQSTPAPEQHLGALWEKLLNPLRGQVAWGWHDDTPADCVIDSGAVQALPPFPVNGKGSMAAHIPFQQNARTGAIWITGSTFTRGDTDATPRTSDIPEIWNKLHVLHPAAARALQVRFEQKAVQSWAGVRATVPDRLPAVGAVSRADGLHGLHVCCGMGARGLALAMLCGETLAAHLHDEPLPAEKKLAAMLDASRWNGKAKPPVQ